jgi:hypothetical protein
MVHVVTALSSDNVFASIVHQKKSRTKSIMVFLSKRTNPGANAQLINHVGLKAAPTTAQ